MKYTPRRASKRWLDGDCPKGVLAILDHPNTFDRYTIIYAEPICGETFADMRLGYLGASIDPFPPQGFGQHGEMTAHEVASYRYREKHRYARWSDLPDRVKQCVRQDLAP